MIELGLRILVLLAALQQLVFPFFVNPFAGGSRPTPMAEPSQIEPAGYAFAIWGPIYQLAVIYGLWQLGAAGRADPATLRIAPLAIVLYLGSSVWLYAAKYGPLWATPAILLVMAICATVCLLVALSGNPRTGLAWWAVVLPFALYAGWTVCATFVNFAEVAPAFGFRRLGLSVMSFAILSLLLAAGVSAILVWLTNGNVPFTATIIWAFVAIAVAGLQLRFAPQVVGTAIAGTIAIAVLFAIVRLRGQA